MSRILSWLEWLLNLLGAVFVLTILVAVCVQVVMRYVFGNATLWSDPVSSASMAWLTFLTMAAAVRSDGNMSVRFTWNWLSPRGRKLAEAVAVILSMCFAATLIYSSHGLMQVTSSAQVEGLPFEVTWAQMYSVALGAGVFIIVFGLERLLRLWVRGAS